MKNERYLAIMLARKITLPKIVKLKEKGSVFFAHI